MATRNRKVRRLRGSRHMGWGQVAQHRKHGRKGGRGNAGLHKHKWTWTVKYDPDHFGGVELKPRSEHKSKKWVNVGSLDGMAVSPSAQKSSKGGKGVMTLDLISLDYDKILGSGEVKGAYKVICKSVTESAKAKIEKAGGQVVIAS